jgi:hypothetical protein
LRKTLLCLRTSFRISCDFEFKTCVAPNSFASSSLESAMSTAIIVSRPRCLAAINAVKPTEPSPKMSNDSDGAGFNVLSIAPAPVWNPQPP